MSHGSGLPIALQLYPSVISVGFSGESGRLVRCIEVEHLASWDLFSGVLICRVFMVCIYLLRREGGEGCSMGCVHEFCGCWERK